MTGAVTLQVGPTIGQGTSGEVAKLLNSIDGGSYVLKRVPLDRSAGDAQRSTFVALEEVRLHRLVSSGCDSIVRYAFSNLAGSELLVCMEACDLCLWDALAASPGGEHSSFAVGGLASCAAPSGREKLREQRVALHMELAGAVRHCHELRVLHRDVNPWNIFLCRREGSGPPWAAKLGDFGLALRMPDGVDLLEGNEAHGAAPLDESALGSLYSAPELGKVYGFPADIFSLGMTLLALWSAASCDDEDTLICVVEKSKQAAVEGIAPELGDSAHSESMIRRMLHPSPSARPAMVEVCEGVAGAERFLEEERHARQDDIQKCFQSVLGQSTRLVQWAQLSKVIAACGLPESTLGALEAVWGRDVDGVLDYTLFLDWVFRQDSIKLAA